MELKYFCISYIFVHLTTSAWAMCKLDSLSTCLDSAAQLESCYFLKNRTSLKYSMIGNINGIPEYNVEFISLENNCGFDKYDVTIDRISNVTREADCKYVHGFSKLETMQTKEIPVSPCTQLKLNFCMLYWFSGCYQFTFAPYKDTNSVRPVNHYIWMVNNYTREDFLILPPDFKNSNQKVFEATWTFQPNTFLSEEISFTVRLEPYVDSEEVPLDPLDISENCTYHDQIITCQYRNLSEGNYLINLSLQDEWRCSLPYGVFGACDWAILIERYNLPSQENGALKSSLDWIVTSLVALIIGVGNWLVQGKSM